MNDKYLRRYTDIPALTYLLSERKITLLDPQSWDDSNDSHYLSVYKENKKLESVLALCFVQAAERYHHWRLFAGGSSGVCIRFDGPELLRAITKHRHIRTGPVKYLTLGKLRRKTLATDDLPFIKRIAFQDEDEFRLIYESKTTRISKLDISIPLSCIARITLSPWAHKSLLPPVKRLLKTIKGCEKLEVVRSTLVSNEEWKSIGESAV